MRNDLWHYTVEVERRQHEPDLDSWVQSQANWTLVDAGSGFAPSVRAGCTSAMDAAGRFWLFGGRCHAANLLRARASCKKRS